MNDTPNYLRVSEVVHAHKRILTSELRKLFGLDVETWLGEAERIGLIRKDGRERIKDSFRDDDYWAAGRRRCRALLVAPSAARR